MNFEPAVRHLRFYFEKGDGFYYLDLARELSVLNNRLYHQGKHYHVANITFSSDQDGRLQVLTIPNTWAMKRAWIVGFEKWLQMNDRLNEEDRDAALSHAKYVTFRVGMCKDQLDSDDGEKPGEGTEQDSMAVDYSKANKSKIDEWRLSTFVSTDEETVDEFNAYMMGVHDGSAPDYTSISLIQAYQETLASRKIPLEDGTREPTMLSGVWANFFEIHGSQDDIKEELMHDYDAPPWDGDSLLGIGSEMPAISSTNPLPGATVVRELHMDGDQVGQIVAGGFSAPLGLICLRTSDMDQADQEFSVCLELVPGDYQGVSATRIHSKTIRDSDGNLKVIG